MAQAKGSDYARFDHALLISLSNGLGTWLHTGDVDSEGREVKEKNFYQKDQDCLGCLKDLQRFLRKDDPDTRDVFFKLGAFDTARKDLVPLLIHYPQDHAIVYNSLKVLTFLTMPVITTSARPQEQQQLIDKVKEAFLLHPNEGAMTVVAGVAAAALERHPRMSEEQACTVQLVLTFLRNLLYVPEVQVNRGELRSNYLQEALYKNLFESDVMELLMVISQHAGERPFKSEMALLLDIFHQIYRGTEPEALIQAEAPRPLPPATAHGTAAAQASQQRQQGRQTQQARGQQQQQQPKQGSQAQDAIAGEMLKILAMEKARKAAALAGAPRWHSRNPARFVRQHAEHSRPVFLAKPQVSELPELHIHVPATKAIAVDGAEVAPGSAQLGPALMWRLRQWTDELCSGDGYNALMKVLMKEAEPGIGISRLAAPDFARLMRVARFFTAYARLKQEARQQRQQKEQQQQQQQQQQKQQGQGRGHIHGQQDVGHAQRLSADPLPIDHNGVPVWQNQAQEALQSTQPQQHATAADAGSDAEDQQQQQQREQGPHDAAAQERQQQEAAEAESPFACIASTMGWNTFYLVLTSWLGQVDVPAKSDLKDWELQHASLSLLREMLAVLELAERVGNMPDRRAADKLQRRLLHDDMKESGLLCVLSRLMRSFNAKLQPRAHAVDIIQSMHTVLKMYDRLCAAEDGGFVVRRKAHAGGGRRKQQMQNAEEDRGGTPGPPDVDGAAEGQQGEGDGAEGSHQQQKSAEAENQGNPEGGGGRNGDGDGEGGEEQRREAPGSPAASASRNDNGGGREGGGDQNQPRRDPMEELEEDEEWDEGGDPDQRTRRVKEATLDLNKRLRQELATPATIHFYTTQGLVFYAHNSSATNAAITALLERISSPDALDLEPMLYQLSVLRVMHKILSDRSIRSKAKLPAYQGLLRLCTRVVRGLMAKLVPVLESEDVVPSNGKNTETQAGSRDGGGAGPAAGGAAAGAEKQNGGGESDSLEIEGEGEEGAGGEGVESKSSKERCKAVAFENKIKRGISSMLFIDLMFWKTAMVAEEISNDYFLRLDQDPAYDPRKEASKAADKGGMTAGAGRSMQAWDEEEEQEGMGAGADAHTGAGAGADANGSSGDEGNEGKGEGARGQAGRAGEEGQRGATREQQAAGAARRVHAMDAETLMQRREMLRKAHFKQSKRAAAGGGGSAKPQLSPEQVAKLVGLFERYNAHKANMDTIVEAMGEGFSKGQAAHELRAQGLKFGQLTPKQLDTLRKLYGRYRLEQDMSTLIAAELSGGWTSRQITSLLKKHRLTDEDEEEDAADEDGADEEPIDNDALAEAFMLHKGREDVLAKVVEELGGQVSQRAVLRRLRKLKLVRNSASSGRRARGGASRNSLRVDVAQLRELFEQYKDKSDMLNQIAAHLPGGFSAKQVQRLLKKHEVLVDEGVVRKKARQAEERTRLTAAYQRHRLKPQYLEAIAEDMPGIVTVQQVLRMLRKHGLVDGGVKRASRQLQEISPIGSDEGEGGGTQHTRKQRAGSEEAAHDGSRRLVPQPDPSRMLQALKAMEHAHDGRWMEPQRAVAWVQSKLSAAEALWAETQPPHVDYALVMEAEEDEAFFMTDYSQELLEAAGIRNDAGDYYKIPGNSTPAWRASMRSALERGLQRLDTPEADELYIQLRRREAERAEQAAAKAAAAEVEAARARAMGGFGASKTAQGKGRKTGGRLTKRQQQQEEQLRHLDQQLSDDDVDDDAGPSSSAKAATKGDGPKRRGGRRGGSDLEGSSGSDGDSGSSSDSSASSGLGASDADDEEARALPHYSESDAEEEAHQQQRKQETAKGKRSSGAALSSDQSDGEGEVEPADAARKKARPSHDTNTTSNAKAPTATKPNSSKSAPAAQPRKGEASASALAGNRKDGGDQGRKTNAAGNSEEGGNQDGKASRHERVLWGGGSKADARKAALAALAAKRGVGPSQAAGGTPTNVKQQGTSDGEGGSPAAGGVQALPPSRLRAAGAEGPRERSLNHSITHEDVDEGGTAGGQAGGRGGKKRRLMRQGGKENSEAGGTKEVAPAGNAGAGGEVLEDMLEDF